MHPGSDGGVPALGRVRTRTLRWAIGATFLFAMFFAGSIEAISGHHHDSLTGSRDCAVCQVIHASADTPPLPAPAPIVLPQQPCRLDDLVQAGPTCSHLVILRLRAPPTA
jgi:hypothetical protein